MKACEIFFINVRITEIWEGKFFVSFILDFEVLVDASDEVDFEELRP